MNARRTQDEYRSRWLLEMAGYCVRGAVGPLGAWELVGNGATYVGLVRMKSHRPTAPEDRGTLALSPRAWNGDPVEHVSQDRPRWPEGWEL